MTEIFHENNSNLIKRWCIGVIYALNFETDEHDFAFIMTF